MSIVCAHSRIVLRAPVFKKNERPVMLFSHDKKKTNQRRERR
jgi:hypothetical protein